MDVTSRIRIKHSCQYPSHLVPVLPLCVVFVVVVVVFVVVFVVFLLLFFWFCFWSK